MDRNLSRKMPRREANYSRLQEWIKKTKTPRKHIDDVSILTHQYRQGNILNINTAKNEINKLISAANPNLVLNICYRASTRVEKTRTTTRQNVEEYREGVKEHRNEEI